MVKRVGIRVGDKSEEIEVRVSAWCLCGCGETEDWDRECGREERETFARMVMMVVEQEHRIEWRPDQAYMLEQRNVDCGDSL